MQKGAVRDYLDQTRDVEGWFFPIDAHLFAIFDEIQKREGIRGNLFEIGVHHGKTALFLSRMAAPDERSSPRHSPSRTRRRNAGSCTSTAAIVRRTW